MLSNEKPVKVIHMAPLGPGGISKLTVSIHKLLDPKKVSFDYLVFRDRKEFFEDEVIKLGGNKKVVDIENERNPLVKCVKKIHLMRKLFKREQYDVVHVDASTPYDVIVAIAAKMAGVKKIVMHSHNDDYQKSVPLRDMFMRIYKLLMLGTVTDYFTISQAAADFMFPSRILKKQQYSMYRNGINADDYLYDENDRECVRKELGIDNKFVIGHIGRFVYQKNHDFILEVFAEVVKKNSESVLLLVGTGELLEKMKEKAEELEIRDKVIFYGTTHDVRKILLAMDVFMFPSRFEGLGIVAIEAQASGLHICCADTIVEEVNVTDLFHRVHGWDKEYWAQELLKLQEETKRRSYNQEIGQAGYDIKVVAGELEAFYTNM